MQMYKAVTLSNKMHVIQSELVVSVRHSFSTEI